MERRIELIAGLGAGALGLTGVVTEAQALSNPVANPSLVWLQGTGAVPGIWEAIQNAQHALLPLAIVFLALAIGTYLHAVHRQTAGLALLLSTTAVVLAVSGLAVFLPPYISVLFVPAWLLVGTALLAAAASVCALSVEGRPIILTRIIHPRTTPAQVQPHQST